MTIDALIDQLADDARPVRPQSVTVSRIGFGALSALTLMLVLGLLGVRADIASGAPSPVILLIAGLFAITAAAAGLAATRLARPEVGGRQGGAFWLVAAIALLPLISLVEYLLGNTAGTSTALVLRCLLWGVLASSLTLALLGWTLRSGATVLPSRASWLAGIAAGAVGATAITLECPNGEMLHLAIGHVGIVAVSAWISRLVLPPLIRW
ncbi:NrsF family protein [Sphingomonas xanthus]|uniref:DUF1109 domain-containing protein n=1 Tax=Sphingomonas xanthus TaxID=2594473 RepID=A0A516ISS0_9SPHN|nr:NrsF family protein [Sphingomonas xanthus]QDP19945.1 DUF1109 domain-containing protein [Sphingomonas xanthus]